MSDSRSSSDASEQHSSPSIQAGFVSLHSARNPQTSANLYTPEAPNTEITPRSSLHSGGGGGGAFARLERAVIRPNELNPEQRSSTYERRPFGLAQEQKSHMAESGACWQ